MAATLTMLATTPLAVAAAVFWWTRRNPPSPDATLLARLRRAGADLSAVHRIEFYLCLGDEDRATAAAQSLRAAGLRVHIEQVEGAMTWAVVVTHSMVPDAGRLATVGERLQAHAEAYGGEYSGWSAAPVLSVRMAAAKLVAVAWLLAFVAAFGLSAEASLAAGSALFLALGLPLLVVTAGDVMRAVEAKS